MTDLLTTALLTAFIGVGVTEIIKKWLPANTNAKWYTVIFSGLTLAVGLVYDFLPSCVTDGLLALSAGSLGYDNIIKIFQKVIHKIGGVANDTGSTGSADE
jgi:hypothetical protein